MTQTVHLLVGPDAGRGKAGAAVATVRRTLAEHGVTVHDITGSDAAASATAAHAAVADGAERIVVVGGDGLVHLGLQAVAETDTVLGVVAVGTGNDFVRGLPERSSDAAAATRDALGNPVRLDAIRLAQDGGGEAHWVASVATAGFSGDVNARANRLRFPKGPSRYTMATVLEIPRMKNRPLTLTVDGEPHDYRVSLIAIANTGWFGGGMHICPDADPADGLLDVTVVADASRLELLRFFRLVFRGRHLSHPKVHTHRGREIRIAGDGIELWGDGENLMTVPAAGSITARAVAAALPLASATVSDTKPHVAR